MSSHLRIQGND